MQSTDPTAAFPLDDVDALIADLEATVTGDIPLVGPESNGTWPSEICTGRPTCVPR